MNKSMGDVSENETVEVISIIKKMPDSFKQEIEELKEAVRDDLFLDDLIDVSEDFITADSEGWVEEKFGLALNIT